MTKCIVMGGRQGAPPSLCVDMMLWDHSVTPDRMPLLWHFPTLMKWHGRHLRTLFMAWTMSVVRLKGHMGLMHLI